VARAKPRARGSCLTQAAQQQNWDPSIQALVVFPDLVKRLNQDITWTTNLGNAFLSQQADVMDSVQRMRLKAQQAGKLSSTSQETVTTTNDSGQPVIDIEPSNPQVIYLPNYDPRTSGGHLSIIPTRVGSTSGLLRLRYRDQHGLLFWRWLGGWGGWGWHPGWGGRNIIVNNSFVHRYNFNSRGSASLSGTSAWHTMPPIVEACLFKRRRGEPLSRYRTSKSANTWRRRAGTDSRRQHASGD